MIPNLMFSTLWSDLPLGVGERRPDDGIILSFIGVRFGISLAVPCLAPEVENFIIENRYVGVLGCQVVGIFNHLC